MAPSTTIGTTATSTAAPMYAPLQDGGAVGRLQQPQQQVDSIRSRLMACIGVQPSKVWLQACLSHIQNKNKRQHQQQQHHGGGGCVLIDAVLHQVLHSDLRDVVRGNDCDSTNSTSDNTSASLTGDFRTAAALTDPSTTGSSPAVPVAVTQLHQAVQQSNEEAHKFQHTILKSCNSNTSNSNNSFSILVQLEEVVDVSLPAEKRLEVGIYGNTSTSGNVQNRQQPYRNGHSTTRCLKLCLTDGYHQSHTFVAVEQQFIPNLSSASPAGLKLLLRAPLTVKHSQLLLHSGNCIALGGVVSHLYEQQQKALRVAIQEAGVGVDPTVRALIGTSATTNEDENDDDEDEAHEASGDVQPQAQQPLQQLQTTTAPQQQQQRFVPPPPPVVPDRDISRLTNTYNGGSGTSSTQSAWAGSSTTAAATTTSNVPPLPTNPYAAKNPPQQRLPIRHLQHHTPPPSSPSRPSAINPYASASSQVSTSTTASTTNTATAGNLYESSSNNVSARSTSTTFTETATTISSVPSNPYQRSLSSTANSTPGVPSNVATANNFTATISATSNPALPTTPVSTMGQSVSSSTQASLLKKSPPPAVAIQNMEMPSLYQLLTNLISSREMYESYYTRQNMGFRVQLKQFAAAEKITFNVVKAKKNKRKEGSNDEQQRKPKKKYEYFVSSIFEGVGSASNMSQKHAVACRIHPDLVEPHFPISATELRSMNRSEREKCGEITRVGGDKIKEVYFHKVNSWIATLHLPPDQVFDEEIASSKSIAERLADTDLPILLLLDPKVHLLR